MSDHGCCGMANQAAHSPPNPNARHRNYTHVHIFAHAECSCKSRPNRKVTPLLLEATVCIIDDSSAAHISGPHAAATPACPCSLSPTILCKTKCTLPPCHLHNFSNATHASLPILSVPNAQQRLRQPPDPRHMSLELLLLLLLLPLPHFLLLPLLLAMQGLAAPL